METLRLSCPVSMNLVSCRVASHCYLAGSLRRCEDQSCLTVWWMHSSRAHSHKLLFAQTIQKVVVLGPSSWIRLRRATCALSSSTLDLSSDSIDRYLHRVSHTPSKSEDILSPSASTFPIRHFSKGIMVKFVKLALEQERQIASTDTLKTH
jgi:hypothetical protein